VLRSYRDKKVVGVFVRFSCRFIAERDIGLHIDKQLGS
jgi:hypothetical protein